MMFVKKILATTLAVAISGVAFAQDGSAPAAPVSAAVSAPAKVAPAAVKKAAKSKKSIKAKRKIQHKS